MSGLELEARAYWSGVQRFRMMSGLAEDKQDLSDDLDLIAQYTENPVIRRDIARVLAPIERVVAK